MLPKLLLGLAVPALTARQQQIVGIISESDTLGDAAARLGMSPNTLSARLRTIAARLGLSSSGELIDLARRHAVLDAVPEGIYGLDSEGRCTFANRRAAEMFGYQLGELVGKQVHPVLHGRRLDGSEHPRSECQILAAVRDGTARSVDRDLFWSAADEPVWAAYTVVPVTEDDRAHGAVVSVRDITQPLRQAESMELGRLSLELSLEAGGAFTYQIDLRSGVVKVSDNFESLVGLPPGGFDGSYRAFLDLVADKDRSGLLLADVRTRAPGTVGEREITVQLPNGELRWFKSRDFVLAGFDGQASVVLGAAVDVTAQYESDRVTREMLDNLSDAYVGTDGDGKITDWNNAAQQLMQYSRSEVLGQPVLQLIIPARYAPAFRSALAATEDGPSTQLPARPVEISVQRADGQEIPVEMILQAVKTGRHVAFRALIRDIRTRRALESALERHALYDESTGMPNRALLLDRLREAVAGIRRENQTVSVVFVEVEKEAITSCFGHRAADQVMAEAAQRLRRVTDNRYTVARIGASDFALIIQDSTVDGIQRLAEEIVGQLREPVVVGGREVTVPAVNVGIAIAHDARTSGDDLLRDAGIAALTARGGPRPRVKLFHHSMRSELMASLDIDIELQRAVRGGEIEVWYQPIVSLQDDRVVGAEALARWRHPSRGLLGPEEFMATAESTGLVVSLGDRVLQAACCHLAEWTRGRGEFGDLFVSVNVAPQQLARPAMAASVREALCGAALEPSSLQLEMTETALMDGARGVAAALDEIHRLGVRIAADDFGTGYSCLSYLRRFPIGVLKLDRTFVAGVGSDPTDTAIVRSTIDLAAALKLKTVAEGVETESQAHALRDLGCEAAQGYLWGRPVPAEEFQALLAGQE